VKKLKTMAHPERIMFNFQEVVECLIKKQGIHEGLWGISVSFGFGAVNASNTEEPEKFLPAAVVPIQQIGIQKFEVESNLTVDAAKVNPRPAKKTPAKKSGKSK
jgi:hypothetical protein